MINPDEIWPDILRDMGTRITNINETTRQAVMDEIRQGLEAGESPGQIGDRIEDLGIFSEYRGELIARTETNRALNLAQLDSYQSFGVEQVQAIDGDQWDEVCAQRDGQIFSVDEAQGIEDHPNGTLDWSPVIRGVEGTPQTPPEEPPALEPTPVPAPAPPPPPPPAAPAEPPPLGDLATSEFHLDRMPLDMQREVSTVYADLQARVPVTLDRIGVATTRDLPAIRGAAAVTVNGRVIMFSNATVSDAAALARNAKYAVDKGFWAKPGALTPIQQVAVHEYGHAVDSQIFGRFAARDAVIEADLGIMPITSTYGRGSMAERWAEGFAEWFAGVDTPAARWVARRLEGKGFR